MTVTASCILLMITVLYGCYLILEMSFNLVGGSCDHELLCLQLLDVFFRLSLTSWIIPEWRWKYLEKIGPYLAKLQAVPCVTEWSAAYFVGHPVQIIMRFLGVGVGCLMLIAWMMCASTALILSKYYKRMWPNDQLCGVEVWFAVSLILSLSVSLCVSVSVCVSLCLSVCLSVYVCVFVLQTNVAELPAVWRWSLVCSQSDTVSLSLSLCVCVSLCLSVCLYYKRMWPTSCVVLKSGLQSVWYCLSLCVSLCVCVC